MVSNESAAFFAPEALLGCPELEYVRNAGKDQAEQRGIEEAAQKCEGSGNLYLAYDHLSYSPLK